VKGKVALVTGSSRGIGAAMARRLAAEGWNVCLNFRRDSPDAEILERELIGLFPEQRFACYRADVADFQACGAMIGDITAEMGSLDALINNAGVSRPGFLMLKQMEDWWDVMRVNLGGAVHCTKHALPIMIRQKNGIILNIGSLSGTVGRAGNTDYCASKAALEGFTRALSKEVCRFNIRVNCLALGYIDTEMTSGMPKEERDALNRFIPMKRMGTAEEVAQWAAFLLSEQASYCIGQVIPLDGGLSA
jgi:3-oxoacyl-[acyl-carrier protein] reductase